MSEPGFLGQKSLNRKLRMMGPVATEEMKPVITAIGQELRFEMLSHIPVDEGDLAAALHMQVESRGLSVRVGYWKKGNKKRWLLAGWRAHFVVFGTVKKAARDFMTPAFNKVRRNAGRDIDKAVDRLLRRVAR